MENKKITILARMKAKQGMEEEVKQVLLSLVGPTRAEAGCINYDLHQSTENRCLFMLYENWVSQKALEEHMGMPHLKAFMKKPRRFSQSLRRSHCGKESVDVVPSLPIPSGEVCMMSWKKGI